MTPHPELLLDDTVAPPGKDEMNFAEFPIALLTDRVPKGQTSIKFEDQIYDEKRKKLITRRRIIEGSQEYGLPTATDDAVVLALIQLTKLKSNFKAREVEFTRLELIKMLGWPDDGRSYDRIKLSLLRIANVTYNYDNAWWDSRQKTWTTKAFHIIDTVEINDSRSTGGQGGLFPSRIMWGDAVYESFQAGFLRNIDFQLCMRLEHPTALRMYRFLGKRFYLKSDWTFDLKEFAYEHIGLGRNYEGGTQISRKLQPAITELEKAGFLEPLSDQERFSKQGREWLIRFIQKAPAQLPAAELSPMPSAPPLVTALVGRGVSRTKAFSLVEQYPDALIQSKLDVLDWLVEKKDKRISASPAGFLVKSIQDDYAVPKGYSSQADRARRKAEIEAEARQEAENRRRDAEKLARERAETQAIDAYWHSLSPEQQAEIDAASKAQADPKDIARESGPLGPNLQRIRRETYLRATGKLPPQA